jgi:catechol 2,3-dioxygenase-like lactoylglutathione lyase family enzyme
MLREEEDPVQSLFPDICSDDVAASRDFYVSLFGFRVAFEIAWYVQLQSPDDPRLQLAFVARDHESVPAGFGGRPHGVLVTVETEDVDALHQRACALGVEIVYALRDEPWGQRHFMAKDPNGLLVDVVQLIPPEASFLREHGLHG